MHLVNNTDCLATLYEQTILLTENQKILAEKDNDEKLAITLLIMGAEMNDYNFW